MRAVPSTTLPARPPTLLLLPYTFSYNILSPGQILLIELSNNLKSENGERKLLQQTIQKSFLSHEKFGMQFPPKYIRFTMARKLQDPMSSISLWMTY